MLPVFAACTTEAPSDGMATLGSPDPTTTGDEPGDTSTGAGLEGDPAALDFATNGWDFDPGDVTTLESFARDEGGGLYLIAEYWGGGMGQSQLDSINALAAPYDVAFGQQSLAWGPAGAAVELDCFPSPEG